MKTLTFFLFLLIVQNSIGQAIVDTSTYAFPIGTHFILQLVEYKNELKYTVTKSDPYSKSLDYSNSESLFEKTPINGTIECYFGKGIDQKGPFKSVLLVRNNSKSILEYKALISYENRDGFYETSVVDLFPGVKSSELWNDNLSGIVLTKFQKKK